VLDIGADIGALVAYVGAQLADTEIEVCREPSGEVFTHTGVHPRTTAAGRDLYAAVFPQLPAGSYRLRHPDGSPGPSAEVRGGRVTELNWLDAAPLAAAPAEQEPAMHHDPVTGHTHQH
jgi:hypothetical protein